MANDILIVDDEADIRDLVAGILDDEGFTTRTARDSDSALAEIANRRPHLVFLDIWLQGSKLDGLQLLEQIKKDNADLPVVMISGHGNIETAVAAIKRGAYDFIEKPFKSDRLILVATRALETSRLKREVKELKQLAPAASVLTGRSACMNQLRQTIERAAKANSRIMIVGPSGAGKELAARTLHNASEPRRGAVRRDQCRGDHAGADGSRAVRHRADPTASTAARPARWRKPMAARCSSTRSATCRARPRTRSCGCWSTRRSSARAAPTKVHVDVRIISSTARNLEEEIAEGRFREDLYHRLSVVPIRVPPLSERREDIPELIDYFMDQISVATGLPKRQIGQDAMAVLQSHVWPGNVRQLRNNVERVMILASGGPEVIITADMLPQDVGSMVPAMPTSNNGEHIMGLPLREAREVFERDYLIAQISRFSGNISRTAEFVGMERSALHRKLKALGVG